MNYNEIESKSLGKLKILANIDNMALLERMNNISEEYIIATNFNIDDKSWDFGSYYYSFQDAIEEFTERVLSHKNLKSNIRKTTEELYDVSTRVLEIAHNIDRVPVSKYLNNQKEMKMLQYQFKENTINDKKLCEHFKDSKVMFSEIMVAGTILGGIDLRNLQKENNNLSGEKEEYPYNKEQIKMIDRYFELERENEHLENQYQENYESEEM